MLVALFALRTMGWKLAPPGYRKVYPIRPKIVSAAPSGVEPGAAVVNRTRRFCRHAATGEYDGLYLWQSPDDFVAYRESELRASIAEAYQVEGEPRVEVYRVLETLRDGTP